MMLAVNVHSDFISHYPDTGHAIVDLSDIPAVIADHLDAMASRYPAEVFNADSGTSDAIAGTALRVVLSREAARLRENTK